MAALLALASLAALAAGAAAVLNHVTFFSIGWLEHSFDFLGIGAAIVLACLLFPLVQPLFVAFFAESVIAKVERTAYPEAAGEIRQPLSAVIRAATRFMGLSLVLNLCAVPFYLIPVVNLAAYYGVNGYLLGREWFEAVAAKHLSFQEAARLRKSYCRTICVLGAGFSFLLTLPFINLFTPLMGIACMTHLMHKISPIQKVA